MAKSESKTGGGGMAGDSGDGGHGEREKGGDDRLEDMNHVEYAVSSGGFGGGGLSPGKVEAIGEEAAMGGGDQNGTGSGLGVDLGEKREEGGNQGWSDPVLVVAGEGDDEEITTPLKCAHGSSISCFNSCCALNK